LDNAQNTGKTPVRFSRSFFNVAGLIRTGISAMRLRWRSGVLG
jgi:hypothetical protein